jgi:general secretion pathway protein D
MHSLKPICTLILVSLLFSGCTSGRTAFSKAQKLESDGNLDAALVKYAEVATANPDVGEYRVGYLKATDAAARMHFKRGETFFAQKNFEEALREYQSAYAIDPTNLLAKQQSELLTRLKTAQTYYLEGVDFEKNRKPREAMASFKHALEFDPNNKVIKEAMDRLLAIKKSKLDGYELNLKSTKPITLKFKDAKLKEIFSILSQLSGINFVFDDTVKDVNISLFLENATFQQTMEIITGMQKLGKKVLNESTIILYPKSPDKFKQYEELYVQTFYLNKLDAKKAVNLIRTMLQVKKIYVNEEMNALVIRDTPDVVEVARKILEANDVPDAEVLLDVEVFELSKSNAETFGMALSKYSASLGITTPQDSSHFLADSLSAVSTTSTSTTTSTTTSVTSPTNLLNLFAYRGFNGFLTVPNATFNFGKTLANGETLSNPKIRVKNREKAKFNVGTRVPITTTSSPSGGGVSVNVQYVDVGVKVNAEPTIQLNNEVSIKLGLEVSSILSQQTIGTDQATTVVTIGTRNLDTVLSLKDGETSIIGGLIQNHKTDNKNKVFLLGDIPFLGALFTNTNKSADKNELMLAITPRIVRGVTVPENDVAAFWSGREDEPSSNKPYSSFTQDSDFVVPPAPAAAAPAAAAPAASAPTTALPGVAAPAVALPAPPPPPVATPVPGRVTAATKLREAAAAAAVSAGETPAAPATAAPATGAATPGVVTPGTVTPGALIPGVTAPGIAAPARTATPAAAVAGVPAPAAGATPPAAAAGAPSAVPGAVVPAPAASGFRSSRYSAGNAPGMPVPGAGAATPAAVAPAVNAIGAPAVKAPAAPVAPGAGAAAPAAVTPAPAPGVPVPVPVPAAGRLSSNQQVAAVPGAPAPATAPAPAAVPATAPAKPAAAPVVAAPVRKQVAANAPQITLSMDVPASVKLNDLFTVQIKETGASNLQTSVFVVKYPKNLEAQNQTEGSLMKQKGAETKFQSFADKAKREVWVSVTRMSGSEGAAGDGVLAAVTFKAVEKGPAAISLTNSNFTNPVGEAFVVTPSSTVVEVK